MKYRICALLTLLLLFGNGCRRGGAHLPENPRQATDAIETAVSTQEKPHALIPVNDSVTVAQFFHFLDRIVQQYDSLTAYPLSEHLLLRANPWILDRLTATDYYDQKERGRFVYDQSKMAVLWPGDTLCVPGPAQAASLLEKMGKTHLDVNIPAFEMRILEGDSVLHAIRVRVGKNQRKYLAMAKGMVDLRTHTGEGEIIRINRYPVFYDPVDGKKFETTLRDDLQRTKMPQIPWLEPSINGIRYGQMIHPTTNPRSLGKPASNGCIGVSEADAWRVYYYAPIGTKVRIRYDLLEIRPSGDTLRYRHIYPRRPAPPKPAAAPDLSAGAPAEPCWCEESL